MPRKDTNALLSARNRNYDKERAVVSDAAKLQNELKALLASESPKVQQFVYDAIPLRAPRFWTKPEQTVLVQLARLSCFIDDLQTRMQNEIAADPKVLLALDKLLGTAMRNMMQLRQHIGINRLALFSNNPDQTRNENQVAAQVLEIADDLYPGEGKVANNTVVDTSWLLNLEE